MHAIGIWLANNKVSACLFCLSEQVVSTELVVYLTVNGNFNAFHVKMLASEVGILLVNLVLIS
jgi:predicted signal transduction protein with EAL and GGDEF domain